MKYWILSSTLIFWPLFGQEQPPPINTPASVEMLQAEKELLQAQNIYLQAQIMLIRAEQKLEVVKKAQEKKLDGTKEEK